jgi:acyl-CoA thioesterase-1
MFKADIWKRFLLGLVLAGACTLAQAAVPAGEPTILVSGDSLSAAYGMPLEQGWVALLQRRLREQGYPHRVVNTSVSGETTSGGLARLPQALKRHQPRVVLIELGANDGLRGQPLKQIRANLSKMIKLSRDAGAEPLLFEMRLPSNYGKDYTEGFHRSFAELARAEKVPLVPFFLTPIVMKREAFLSDGIHPTAAVQPQLLEAIWPTLEPLLGKPAQRPSAQAPRSSPPHLLQTAAGRYTAGVSVPGPDNLDVR